MANDETDAILTLDPVDASDEVINSSIFGITAGEQDTSSTLDAKFKTGLPPKVKKLDTSMDGKLTMKFNKPMRLSNSFVEELQISRTKLRKLNSKEEPNEFIKILYEPNEIE